MLPINRHVLSTWQNATINQRLLIILLLWQQHFMSNQHTMRVRFTTHIMMEISAMKKTLLCVKRKCGWHRKWIIHHSHFCCSIMLNDVNYVMMMWIISCFSIRRRNSCQKFLPIVSQLQLATVNTSPNVHVLIKLS